jgi:hypothetical protein
MGNWVLRLLAREPGWVDDPRAPAATERMRGQVKAINQALMRKRAEIRLADGEPEPDEVTVGLKAVRMTARRGGK